MQSVLLVCVPWCEFLQGAAHPPSLMWVPAGCGTPSLSPFPAASAFIMGSVQRSHMPRSLRTAPLALAFPGKTLFNCMKLLNFTDVYARIHTRSNVFTFYIVQSSMWQKHRPLAPCDVSLPSCFPPLSSSLGALLLSGYQAAGVSLVQANALGSYPLLQQLPSPAFMQTRYIRKCCPSSLSPFLHTLDTK